MADDEITNGFKKVEIECRACINARESNFATVCIESTCKNYVDEPVQPQFVKRFGTTPDLGVSLPEKKPLQQYVPVDGVAPGKVTCSKCGAVDHGLPLKAERKYGRGGELGTLVVTEILLPVMWARVTISERLPGSNRETTKAVVLACPNCNINVG